MDPHKEILKKIEAQTLNIAQLTFENLLEASFKSITTLTESIKWNRNQRLESNEYLAESVLQKHDIIEELSNVTNTQQREIESLQNDIDQADELIYYKTEENKHINKRVDQLSTEVVSLKKNNKNMKLMGAEKEKAIKGLEAKLDKESAEKQKIIKNLEARINQLESKLDQGQATIKHLEEKLNKENADKQAIIEQLDKEKVDKEAIIEKLDKCKKRIKHLEAKFDMENADHQANMKSLVEKDKKKDIQISHLEAKLKKSSKKSKSQDEKIIDQQALIVNQNAKISELQARMTKQDDTINELVQEVRRTNQIWLKSEEEKSQGAFLALAPLTLRETFRTLKNYLLKFFNRKCQTTIDAQLSFNSLYAVKQFLLQQGNENSYHQWMNEVLSQFDIDEEKFNNCKGLNKVMNKEVHWEGLLTYRALYEIGETIKIPAAKKLYEILKGFILFQKGKEEGTN
ncbi:unnamed protein product [Blepharisma stoltei]|uniref:Uncharacterized protein n=1 Tax=Blepharisma stoltei TaxID=1481888 RepID=A0AAU9JVZ2_9CILI|nr:unnamed protein product [Blepharisma stoltei]